MTGGWALTLLGVAWLSGCSAPEACQASSFGPTATATSLSKTLTLTRAGESGSTSVRATLSNLPRLWQDHSNILGGSVSLALSVAYQGTPAGGDGKTQMPRVSARLGLADTDSSIAIGTSEFQAGGVGGSLESFRTCQGQDELGCCQFGESTCTLPLLFSVRRLDGAPFPPVDVTAVLDAEAEVTRCPIDDHQQAKLTLTESP